MVVITMSLAWENGARSPRRLMKSSVPVNKKGSKVKCEN